MLVRQKQDFEKSKFPRHPGLEIELWRRETADLQRFVENALENLNLALRRLRIHNPQCNASLQLIEHDGLQTTRWQQRAASLPSAGSSRTDGPPRTTTTTCM